MNFGRNKNNEKIKNIELVKRALLYFALKSKNHLLKVATKDDQNIFGGETQSIFSYKTP